MSLQERIRQAKESALRAEKQKAQDEKSKRLAQKEADRQRRIEEIVRKENEKKTTLSILDKLGIRQVLEELQSSSYWRGGSVIFDDSELGYSLVYSYKKAEREYKSVYGLVHTQSSLEALPGRDEDGWHRQDDGVGIGIATTSITIRIRGIAAPQPVLEVRDSECETLYPVPGANQFPELQGYIELDDLQVHQKLEELLVRSILIRDNLKHHSNLPAKIAERAQEEITRIVPWHRRMFR